MSGETKKDIPYDPNLVYEMGTNASYAKLLGLNVVEVCKGSAKISMKLNEDMLNPSKAPHGGVILSLADHACGTAAMTLGPCVGGQFSVNFLASPKVGEELVAEASVIHSGRRTRIIEVQVKNRAERIIAKGTAVGIVLE